MNVIKIVCRFRFLAQHYLYNWILFDVFFMYWMNFCPIYASRQRKVLTRILPKSHRPLLSVKTLWRQMFHQSHLCMYMQVSVTSILALRGMSSGSYCMGFSEEAALKKFSQVCKKAPKNWRDTQIIAHYKIPNIIVVQWIRIFQKISLITSVHFR